MSETEKPKEKQSPNWELIEQIFSDIKTLRESTSKVAQAVSEIQERITKIEKEMW